ncbi:MAG: ATP-binding protein [Betaproteobacteria bacterium]|nr:ATP-binding protein [Candidatus Dechloromonas phosphorivorans]
MIQTGRYLQEKAPVLIVGPCGTGKSHLAQGSGHCVQNAKASMFFYDAGLKLCASLTTARPSVRSNAKSPRWPGFLC